MRVNQATLAAHRAAILNSAGGLFRRNGIAAVGIAEITRAAGLTHGAFYGHFASKCVLAAESCAHMMRQSAGRWRCRDGETAEDALHRLIDAYLSPAHRDAPEGGCALPALGAEASRDPALRPAMAAGVAGLAAALTELLAARHPTRDQAACEAAALATLAALGGGLVLARSLAADPPRSDAALTAAAALARQACA
jgi:TetR/AcrR family transcriptional repressor of nem operon